MPRTSIILSFDIEEHDRIEAATHLECPPTLKRHYADRMEVCTHWIVDTLAQESIQATFYIVGQIARTHPALIRKIHKAGHEVASHSLDHLRVHRFTPETFREDIRRSMDQLSQVTGEKIHGFRAPTFSIMQETAWAIDVLAELGLTYDSSIFPVRHDRYGVPSAPRTPFMVRGTHAEMLELPPTTLRMFGQNLPVAGGGYFRLFPLGFMKAGIRQLSTGNQPRVAMLYFHPWEFDMLQKKLPLKRLSKFRTYVGISRSRSRLRGLMRRYDFRRAVDVAEECRKISPTLPRLNLADSPEKS